MKGDKMIIEVHLKNGEVFTCYVDTYQEHVALDEDPDVEFTLVIG